MSTKQTATKRAKRRIVINLKQTISSNDDLQEIESTTLSHLSQTDNVNYEHKTPPIATSSASSDTMLLLNNYNNNNTDISNNNNDEYSDYNEKIHCLEYHKDTVLCVAKCQFLNDNKQLIKYIFSGSQDSSIGVWNIDTFELKGSLLGHCRSILNLYVLNDRILNPLLLSTSRDNCICIWDIKTLSLLFRITGLPSLVYDIEVLSFINNGGYYLYGCCQDTNIFTLSLSILPYLMKLQYEKLKNQYQYEKQMELFKEKTTKKNKKCRSKSNENQTVISSMDNNLNVLNGLLLLTQPSILSPAGFKKEWIDNDDDMNESQLIITKDDNDESSETHKITIKTSGNVTPSKIIDASTHFKLPTSTNEIRELISTDLTVQFLSKSVDEIIDIYYELLCDDDNDNNNNNKFIVHQIFGGCHHGFIYVMKQLQNEYKLITAASDGTIKIWDISYGVNKLKLLSVLTGHSHSVIDFDLIGNKYLMTASRDKTLKIWNIDNINKPHTRYTINDHDSELTAIKVINHGSSLLIVSSSRNGIIKFWNGNTYQCINTFLLNQELRSNQNNKGEDKECDKSPNRLHKEWTCNSSEIERNNKRICVMRFEFMEPSWLIISDTAYRVEIWDISKMMKNNNNIRSISAENEEKKEDYHDIEGILNGLNLSEYILNFKTEKVDYNILFYLSESDLIELNIPLGPRKKIFNYINWMKRKENVDDDDADNGSYNNMITDLSQFISYKSISCKSQYQNDCWNAAYFIQNKAEQFGAETRMVQGNIGKNPVVLAKFTNNNNNNKNKLIRIVMYGHYDVVDINNYNGWLSSPFKLTGKNGYLYGRGTTDNKGPIIVFLYAINELLEEMDKDNDNDILLEIIMIIEGQEEHEWNSGGLREVVEKNMDWLENALLIICSNSYWIGDKVPCLVYGMRGHLQINIAITGPSQDCHSGVHGGAFNEPIFDLISVLSKLKGNNNRVLIPGFYENILPLKTDEIKLYDEIISTFNKRSYLESIGFNIDDDDDNDNDDNDDKALLISKWREPSLSIHNIQQSSNECTVISKYASSVISIRSVPNQNNENIINLCKEYLLSQFNKLSTFNKILISANNIGDHWLIDYNNYIFKCAENAIIKHWKIKPYYIREGGTIPCTNYLYNKLNTTILQFPLGQSTDRAHLENERIRLQNLLKGKDVIKSFLINLCKHHQHK